MTDLTFADDRPDDEESVIVRCRTVDGTPCTLRLRVADAFSSPGCGLSTRMVTVDDDPLPLLQKWVLRTPAGQPGDLEPLDREIRAAHRFYYVLYDELNDAYPPELPRLRYYDVDGDEPFVLLEPYRGVPVPDVLHTLGAQERYDLRVGLLRALHLVDVADVTHGRVSLDTLRWDAATQTVQLVDFERSARLGELRSGDVDGAPADIRDDMWDAGLAIWRTVHPNHVGRGAPDLTDDDESNSALRELLTGVFVDPRDARPTPAEMLVRIRESTEVPARDLGAPLREGRRAFDVEIDRKRRDLAARRAAAGRRPPWWKRLWKALKGVFKRPRPPMEAPSLPLVQCPVCLDTYPWHHDGDLWLYEEEQQQYVKQNRKSGLLETMGYRRCPNPSQDVTEHFLPAMYHSFGPPLVVALIGRPAAGKSHFLTAMISEVVDRHGLTSYGLQASPLDLRRHAFFREEYIRRTECGAQLPGTRERLTEPIDILRIKGPFGERPVAFFDVAGEDLQSVSEGDRVGRFLLGANALVFVHGLEPEPDPSGNQAFETSMVRLRANPALCLAPAVIVATKSDRTRYLPPVDRWLRSTRDPLEPLDPELLHAESRDVYAYLHRRGEHAALSPFPIFDRVTLHFASASGSEAASEKEMFPRGFRPSRALEPLLSLLAMSGMLAGGQEHQVGR
ncbi:MAG: hypothetical protein ACR2GH_07380 [Pseudonocardia sp.]